MLGGDDIGLVACAIVTGWDVEFVLKLGAAIIKYGVVQEEKTMLKRVCDRCECNVKGRCER